MPFCKALLIKTYMRSCFFLDRSPFWEQIYILYNICKSATFFAFMVLWPSLSFSLSFFFILHLCHHPLSCVLILKVCCPSSFWLSGRTNMCNNSPVMRNKRNCQAQWWWSTEIWDDLDWCCVVLYVVCLHECVSWCYLRTVIQRNYRVKGEVTDDWLTCIKQRSPEILEGHCQDLGFYPSYRLIHWPITILCVLAKVMWFLGRG